MFEHWPLVEADLHAVYGIDCEDAHLMASRSWRWLKVRIDGLLTTPPTVTVYPTGDRQVIHATRVAFALNPPEHVQS